MQNLNNNNDQNINKLKNSKKNTEHLSMADPPSDSLAPKAPEGGFPWFAVCCTCIIILVLAGGGVGIYFYLQPKKSTAAAAGTDTSSSDTASETPAVTGGLFSVGE
jgi:hypothetical protein